METALAPTTHALLRPDQVAEMEDEKSVLEKKLHNPVIQDKGAVADQLRRVSKQLETQRPTPFTSDEIDRAVRREAELREQIRQGMLSHEEMRKCPPGAVDRHRRWEKKNKRSILEWQNIQRRLNSGNEDLESASIENFRPSTTTMNLDGALIPGKQFYFGPANAGLPVTFSEAQLAVLRQLNPALADQIGTLTNAQRSEVKDALDGKGIGLSKASQDGKRGVERREAKKRTLSPEHLAAMKAGREAKAKKA